VLRPLESYRNLKLKSNFKFQNPYVCPNPTYIQHDRFTIVCVDHGSDRRPPLQPRAASPVQSVVVVPFLVGVSEREAREEKSKRIVKFYVFLSQLHTKPFILHTVKINIQSKFNTSKKPRLQQSHRCILRPPTTCSPLGHESGASS
jgi:hypothetical protein